MNPPIERRQKTTLEKVNLWIPVISLFLNLVCMAVFSLGIWIGHNNEIIQVWKSEKHISAEEFKRFTDMLDKRLSSIESRLSMKGQ